MRERLKLRPKCLPDSANCLINTAIMLTEKKCAHCKEVKPANQFYKQTSMKDGLNSYCKPCHKKKNPYKPRVKKQNPVQLVGKSKVCPGCKVNKDYGYYHVDRTKANGRVARCKECASKKTFKSDPSYARRKKIYYQKTKQLLSDNITTALHYKNCKICGEMFRISLHRGDSHAQLQRNFCSKECGYTKTKKKAVESAKERAKKDLHFALNQRIRSRMLQKLKGYGGNHSTTGAIKGLPYSAEKLRLHLESKFKPGMTWDKFLKGEIHIDHIVPLSTFNYTSPKDKAFKEAWALKNMQPLWAHENLSKGNRIIIGKQATLSL